ncbi:MAG: GNAT family protein [Cyanobacteria bacterium J06639_16]
MKRTIREMGSNDVDLMINYFLQAEPDFLKGMGADPNKLPSLAEWRQRLLEDFERSIQNKEFYYLIWKLENNPIGHSNINKIIFGTEAFMHLHLWQPIQRRSGHGTFFVKACITKYFEKFKLKNLFCEPYAMNPGPNRILPKVGFELVKTYDTTPGWINFHQTVNRWVLTQEKWLEISKKDHC